MQPPINGKINPSQARYTFKDQVVISCNPGYKVLKVQGLLASISGAGADSLKSTGVGSREGLSCPCSHAIGTC